MIPFAVIFLLNTAVPALPVAAPAQNKADPWFGKDKHDHFALSVFLTGGQVFMLKEFSGMDDRQAVAAAAMSTAVIGLGKELYDHFSGRGHASFRDLLADFAGIGAAVLILSGRE